MSNFQRQGALSNSHVGREFESVVLQELRRIGIDVEAQYKVPCGLSEKKDHKFDFGSNDILIECKSHRWTKTGRMPTAKIRDWEVTMYHFHISPPGYRKIFIVEYSYNKDRSETLLQFFQRTRKYLIPSNVEMWELHPEKGFIKRC